ncbi:MAG: substrate-binding domain-containing protein [Christensenellales bacterium]|jgi:LacI family transcriptional regulator
MNPLHTTYFKKNKKRIGVIPGYANNSLHRQIEEGVQLSAKRFADNVEIITRWISEPSPKEQLEVIHEMLDKGIDGLAFAPLDDQEINSLMSQLHMEAIPVVTFNSDILGAKRLCFVGQDHELAGRVAGELMGKACDGSGDILINFGTTQVYALVQRTTFFKIALNRRYPKNRIVKTVSSYDNEELSYVNVLEELLHNEHIHGVYSVTSGVGAARAILDAKLPRHIHHVCHDIVPEMREMIEAYPNKHFIDFMIGQHPHKQGFYAVKILLEYMLLGLNPPKDSIYLPVDIRVRGNAHQEDDSALLR